MPTLTFQQGLNGYAGTHDTTLRQSAPGTSLGAATTLNIDGDTPSGTGQDDQVLLQFAALFGSRADQIPLGATITKATLTLQTTNSSAQGATLHQMLKPWTAADTWTSMGSGIQADGIEATGAIRATGLTTVGVTAIDVTSSVDAWAKGAANYGWAFLPSGSDGWDFLSSEGSTKPKLVIEYTTGTPPPNTAPVVAIDNSTPLTYTENAAAAAIAPSLTVTDDGTSLTGATVRITTGYANGQDRLDFTSQSGITGAWNATSGTLSLTGPATVAQYEAALRTVTYVNTSDNPSSTARTIEFQIIDSGNATSTAATRSVQVTPVNDAPVANPESYSTSQNTALTIAAAGVLANDTDVDGTTRTAVLVTGPAHGTLSLNPNGSFTYTPVAGYSGSDSFSYKANDGALDSNTATVNLTVTPSSSETRTITFQQGLNGYAGTQDTQLRQASATTNFSGATSIGVDGDDPAGSDQDRLVLLQFGAMFGDGPGQIPLGATITSAMLTLRTTDAGDGASLYRMIRPWQASATWNSLGGGIQPDGFEAALTPDLITGAVLLGTNTFDVTTSLQAWADGVQNNGWAFLPSGSDSWNFNSSEGTTKPLLKVTYTVGSTNPPPNTAPVAANDSASTTQGTPVKIAVLANDTDADGNTLSISSIVTAPTHGTAVVNADGTITYTPVAGYSGSDSFTYKAKDASTDSNAATVSLTITAPPPSDRPFDESYIASTFSGRQRVLEHNNASKSFFVDGDWYAVLPDGAKWAVERFSGSVPEAGQKGGWTKASTDKFLDNNRASDIAWNASTNKLYVLQYYESSPAPKMFKLGYNSSTHSFSQEAEAQIAGTGGKLSATHWGNNKELVIGMDQFGTPLVADIGKATSGSGAGVHLAWASQDLATWTETMIDPAVSAAGENSKVDIVTFEKGTQKYIGLAYSADDPSTPGVTGDVWKFAWHTASSNPTDYATGWQVETVSSTVAIDNHLSAVWDGSNIFIAMKDDKNVVWVTKGLPGTLGDWQTAKATSVGGPSRPTLVVDKANDQLLLFNQEHTNTPYGDIYMKSVSLDGPLLFDPNSPGTRVMHTTTGSSLTDPQTPVHAVDASMDGGFLLVASDYNVRQVWYNQISLGSPELIV